MLARVALVALGLAELLWPRQIVDFWLGLALTNDANVEVRRWVYTVARLEGLALVLYGLSRWRRTTAD